MRRFERAAHFLLELWETIRRHRALKKRKRSYPVKYTGRVKDAQKRRGKGDS